LSIASDTVLTLTLLPGKKWANPSTVDGMTLCVIIVRTLLLAALLLLLVEAQRGARV